MWKIFVGLLIATAILFVVLLVAVGYYLNTSLCSDDSMKEIDGTYKTKIMLLNCGATTDYVTHVQMVDKSFSTDVLKIKGDHADDLQVFWPTEKKMIIEYTGPETTIWEQQRKYRDIEVNFVQHIK